MPRLLDVPIITGATDRLVFETDVTRILVPRLWLGDVMIRVTCTPWSSVARLGGGGIGIRRLLRASLVPGRQPA